MFKQNSISTSALEGAQGVLGEVNGARQVGAVRGWQEMGPGDGQWQELAGVLGQGLTEQAGRPSSQAFGTPEAEQPAPYSKGFPGPPPTHQGWRLRVQRRSDGWEQMWAPGEG